MGLALLQFRCTARFIILICIFGSQQLCFGIPALNDDTKSTAGKQVVTIADTIEMTRLAGDPHYNDSPPWARRAYFSPDGRRFLVVLRRGNLRQGTNDYSLLLFQTTSAFNAPRPDTLLQLSTTSDRDAIRLLRWVDNRTISFLGQDKSERSQVYLFDVDDKVLDQRTHHSTDVVGYWVSDDCKEVRFSAIETAATKHSSDEDKYGVAVTDQHLDDILIGNLYTPSESTRLFSQRRLEGEAGMLETALPHVKEPPTDPFDITLEQDYRNPPRLYVEDPNTKQKMLLYDLNPQFSQLQLAPVEEFVFTATDGLEERGGLFLPIGYVPGRKYPLVIQTHFFNPNTFLIDGPWSSGYAAQVLAGKGFVVIQVGECAGHDECHKLALTPREAPHAMAVYEGVIDALDRRGLIDKKRVGIFAFSRTVYYVTYALTHSTYHFAAAVLEDGIDGGYFQYLEAPWVSDEYRHLYGGPPFGAAHALWAKEAPGFNLDRVSTPVRIMAHSENGALEQWEWFMGLKLLNKPVDMVVLPRGDDGEHLLKKPWEQWVSQQGTVDWFAYWLKEEEDLTDAKRAQYIRWRPLRTLNKQN